jgi:glyoxylase-like metal-dependent hydrolase (beta-lactamase superfamily II)
MAVVASDLVQLSPSLCLWHSFDPVAKADLFASGILTASGTYLVDPIPLAPAALAEIQGPVKGIIVTNLNHWRAAASFSEAFSVPILARPESIPGEVGRDFKPVAGGEKISDDLIVIEIEGAPAGEIALFHEPNGGTLVVGDALIHFEPYGFTFLPAKYCVDPKKMRRSLGKLLPCESDRMLFAHGTPILSGAGDRLKALLDADS